MSAPQFLRVLLRRQQDVNMAGYLRKLSSVPQKAHSMTKSQMQKAAERGGSWEAAFSFPPALWRGLLQVAELHLLLGPGCANELTGIFA